MGFVIRKWFGVEADLSPNGMGLKWVEYGSSESKTKRQLQLHILAAMDGHHLKKKMLMPWVYMGYTYHI